MKRLILTVFVLLFVFSTPVVAQQAGNNIPVLPVVTPDEADDWWTLGDGFLQRQVEPTIGASTLNPDHLLAFFNDYRAIDASDGDVGLGEGEVTAFEGAMKLARILSPPPIADGLPLIQFPASLPVAASEAWIGGSRSYDGGLTWSGFYVPGASWDPDGFDPQVSKDTPIYGLEAATDPVLAPGPCGTFYLAFVAFTRGDQSKMVVARYRDTNDFEGGETFVYDGMTVVETGNNAENGYFLDKPDIEVDVLRPADPANQCGHRVYVTYSTFNGLTKDEKVQTKMNFASATVYGDDDPVFNSIKINKNLNQNQGSAIAVDPRGGTPKAEGGGTLYVFWRHFFDPDAIIVRKSTDYGAKWSNPQIITDDMAPFDQPTIQAQLGREAITFRSNAFPTAAVTDTGTVVAAWQERVDEYGAPAPDGTPRIIVMRSENGGDWEGLGDGGDRIPIDAGARSEPFDPGLATPATQPHPRPSGPQVMPKLSFGGGQLMLSFYESRGKIDPNFGNEDFDYEAIEVGPEEYGGEAWMSGYYRVVDLRAALLNRSTGTLESPSIQVSRYPISSSANLADGVQDLSDVAPINPPCAPDHNYLLTDDDFNSQYPGITAFNPCVRQVNRINSPHSAQGKAAFAGDYNDLVPYVQFIYDTNLEQWRWATQPGDVSTRGFHSVWTDNRHLIPPQNPNPGDTTFQEWAEFPYYNAPNSGDTSCINPGSRNADVLTARINSGLVITAPTTYKQLDAERSFPFTVANQSNTNMFYEIRTAQDAALYSKLNPVYDSVDAVRVMVFPYSSTSQLLTVQPESSGFAGPFKVEARELHCDAEPDPDAADFQEQVEACNLCDPIDYSSGTCQIGSIVFNAYQGNNPVGNFEGGEPEKFGPIISNAFVINYNVPNAFVINTGLDNAFVINGSPENAFVINNSPENAFVINAFVINAFVINQNIFDVVDVVWEMEPGTANTASSYLPLINVDFAEQFLETGNYAFQLIVDKPASYGTYGILDDCEDGSVRAPEGQILSNVVQDPNEIDNAFVINKRPENAFVINDSPENAFVINAFVINSTFPMAPEESDKRRFESFTKEEGYNDSATKADPPKKTVRVTLRAYQLKDSGTIIGNGEPLFNPSTEEGGWMPSNSVADLACGATGNSAACFTLSGPDLQPRSNIVLEEGESLELDGSLLLDAGSFSVFNDDSLAAQGATDAVTRGDRQIHTFVLTGTSPSGTEVNIEIGRFDTNKVLTLGDTATIPAGIALQIPEDETVEEGLYTLVFKADGPLEVSEYDETNNTLELPIYVVDPNTPPVADDQPVTTNEDIPIAITLSGTDADNDPLTFEVTSYPEFGTLTGTAPDLTYSPDTNFNGSDSFTFKVNDGTADSELDGTVSITVISVNDLPVITGSLNFSVAEDASVTETIVVEDDDNDTLTFEITTNPANGTAVLTGTGGEFTYTPVADFNGTDGFTVTISDTGESSINASVSIDITSVNDVPVAGDDSITVEMNSGFNTISVLENDTDADGDDLVVTGVDPAANGTTAYDSDSVFYQPNAGFIGVDNVDYAISDGNGGTASATVTVTVFDPVPDWGFEGLLSPWRPKYSVKRGSAIPLKWYYTNPETGQQIDSSIADPVIRIKGPVACWDGVDTNLDPIVEEDTGSSNLRYTGGEWQFNWDTAGLNKGCYNVYIDSQYTGQTNPGPGEDKLGIKLR